MLELPSLRDDIPGGDLFGQGGDPEHVVNPGRGETRVLSAPTRCFGIPAVALHCLALYAAVLLHPAPRITIRRSCRIRVRPDNTWISWRSHQPARRDCDGGKRRTRSCGGCARTGDVTVVQGLLTAGVGCQAAQMCRGRGGGGRVVVRRPAPRA